MIAIKKLEMDENDYLYAPFLPGYNESESCQILSHRKTFIK